MALPARKFPTLKEKFGIGVTNEQLEKEIKKLDKEVKVEKKKKPK